MIAKKSSKADLERKRFAFFQIGLVVAGAATLLAFEYKSVTTEPKKVVVEDNRSLWIAPEEEIIDESILETRPQPQPTSLQMEPQDEVRISTISPVGQMVSQLIVINDPCIGCEEILVPVDDTPPGTIYPVADIDPSFPGGEVEMANFIQKNIVYPSIPREMGEQGIVYVQFVVNTDGTICQVKSINEMHPDLIKEAERVIAMMPKWIPGEQAGKKVRVRFTVPINFKIQ